VDVERSLEQLGEQQMYNIAYVLRKHSAVRIFFTVALSLAMAVLIGSGLHPAGSNDQPDFYQAPARVQQPAVGTSTAPAARSTLDDVSALDMALKNLGALERDRNSASTSTSAQSNGTATPNSTITTPQPVKSLADTSKTGNPAAPNSINSVPTK
jgi:hypothetical protein